MIQIQPWEASLIKDIEKAILVSDLGLTPNNDGKVIRLIFPELTEERRKELAKDVKKKGDNLSLELERTDDILAYLGIHKKEEQFLCGFSMETQNVIDNSRAKLAKKNLDMVAANNVKVEGAGFQGDTNVLTLITQDEEISLPLMSKEDAAFRILDKILSLMQDSVC